MNKVEVGIRLRQFIKQNFSSISEFAAKIEVQPSSFQSTYLKGRSAPGAELLAKLSLLGCDIEWLLTGIEKGKQEESPIKQFPLVSMVGAGSVVPYDDQPPVMVPLPYKGDGIVLKVTGDSMAALISDGDLVLVDLRKRPTMGHIVAVRTREGEQFIKYLGSHNANEVIFYSHNAVFAPVTFKKENILTIKKVVLIVKDVDYPEVNNNK